MGVLSLLDKPFSVQLVRLFALFIICYCGHARPHNNSSNDSSPFPPYFLFGAASSAYQYEGAYLTDGKGLSNWDVFTRLPGYVEDGTNGDVTIDFYHRYPEIIDLMASIGLNSFQLSISWARILPKGRYGGINSVGIHYYKKIIDTLLSKGIEPFVVLHHFDIPIELEKRYNSWLSTESIEDFKYFADICFENFGDKIKYWVTFSEPNTMIIGEYETGQYPPAHCSVGKADCTGDPKEPLLAGHNIILAHAAAVKISKTKYQKEHGGQIGMVVETQWFIPLSNSTEDKSAAERAQSFFSNWFFDPIVFGRYPKEMIDILGDSLPKFSDNDIEDLKTGIDFVGINHYTSVYVWDCLNKSCEVPASAILGYDGMSFYKDGMPIGEKTGLEAFYVYPKGMEEIINYVKERLNNIPMYITENGYSEIWDSNTTLEDTLNDVKRVNFLTDYLGAIAAAIRGGADVKGYFLWTLVDDFEWNFGYNKRFGIHHFDSNTKKITPKSSASWYKHFIQRHKTTQAIVPETKNPHLLLVE